MANFDQVVKATEASVNSLGATEQQNAEYQKGLEYSISQLKAQWESFVLGEGGLQSAVKTLIDVGTTILKVVNALGGLKTVVLALTGLLITKKIDSVVKGIGVLKTTVGELISKLALLVVAAIQDENGLKGLAQSFVATRTEAQLLQLTIGGLFTALTAGVAVFSLVNSAVENHNQKIAEMRENAINSANSVKTEIDALEELKNKISSENLTRIELDSILAENIDGYDAENSKLEDNLDYHKQAIDLLDEEAQKRADLWLKENETQGMLDQENLSTFSMSDTSEKWYQDKSNYARGIGINIGTDDDVTALQKYDEAIKQLKDDYDELSWSEQDRLEELQEERNALYSNIQTREENAANMLYMKAVVDGTNDSLDAYNEFCKNSETQQDRLKDSTEEINEAFEQINEQYGYSKEKIDEFVSANDDIDWDGTAEGLYDIAQAMLEAGENSDTADESLQNLSSDLKTLATDYESIQSAVDEFNSGGQISLEALDSLIAATTNYSGCLDMVDGQLVLTDGYFEQLAQSKIANAKADLLAETQARLDAIAQGDLSQATSDASGVINSATSTVDDICISLRNMQGEAISAAQAWTVLARTMDGGKLREINKSEYDQIYSDFTTQWKTLDKLGESISGNFGNYAKSMAKSSGSSAKSSKDAWLEAYKAEKDAVDKMYENGTYTAEQYQEKLLELQSKYLTDTAAHQEAYASEIRSLYEDIYKALKKAAKEALDDEANRLKKELDNLKDEAKRAKELQKRQHEEEEKAIKNRIELLKREKESVKDSYNEKIDALKAEREEYERQVKLMELKEALAKAKATMQYVMDETGRFTWLYDQNAVDEAKEELYEEELKQAYERQLQDLEDARDAADKLYDQQIQDLEDYYDSVQDRNEKAEQALEDHYTVLENQYERNYNDFKEYANKVLDAQVSATNDENTEWGRRLNNLANFVNEYNAMLSKLGSAGSSVSNNYSGNSSGTKSSVGSSSSGGSTKTGYTAGGVSTPNSQGQVGKQGKGTAYTPNYTGGKTSSSASSAVKSSASVVSAIASAIKGIGKHAEGIAAIDTNEMALVGDSPNTELVVGSKLNGVPLTLSKGSGVVNAKSTKTLAGLLNNLPNLSRNYNTTNNSHQQSIHIENISLPQVTNGSEFISYLQNFDIDMIQASF